MSGRHGHLRTLVRSWVGRNVLPIATAALVIASVVGTGTLILSVADRENPLREADLGLAELGTFTDALIMHPRNVVDRGDAAASDLLANRGLGARARAAVRKTVRNWSNPVSRRIERQTRRAAMLSGDAIELVGAGEIGASYLVLRRLARRVDDLDSGLRDARDQLADEIGEVQDDATVGMFAVTSVLGVALVAVMLGFSAARRRRAREEAEQRAVRHSERRLQALVRHGSDMLTVVAPDTTVLFGAGAVRAVLGFDPDKLEGKKLSEWLHPDDVPVLVSLCASANGAGSAREIRLRHRDGSLRTCEARATSLLDNELWNGIILNVWDVSKRKELEDRLRHQAFHDSLTQLPNRALFGDRLEHALVRGERDRLAVSVLLIDLDDFKSINDSLGHAAGDRLLTEIAQRLAAAGRAADTIARLGGDEFAVIVEDSRSRSDDEQTAQRIIDAIARPIHLGERTFPITASVGIARGAPGEASADQLVRDADLAMYSAKSQEKGTYAAYHPEMHMATEERLQLKADLVHSLEADGQLELYYQPVVSLHGGGVVGLEALLRWNHPTRGQIAPDDFVPLAEETGAILPIGRWVLREACQQGSSWAGDLGRDLLIGVNVSARQLQGSELIGEVRRALRDSGLSPQRLVLEITETALMRDVEQATRVLRAIKRLGVKVAIDDFGTGYSSLSQLERLPVDILKVDREFAGTPEDRAEHTKLLRAVMDIGESLNLRTIAEGIETPEQLEELRALDYPLGQGFLFSRPLPAAAIDALLAEERERNASEPRRAEPRRDRLAKRRPPDTPLGSEAG